jgi:hypothetical protein
MEKSIDDMISELEDYYECAGFENYYARVLKDMNTAQIIQYYKETFEQTEDHELEVWEQKNFDKGE